LEANVDRIGGGRAAVRIELVIDAANADSIWPAVVEWLSKQHRPAVHAERPCGSTSPHPCKIAVYVYENVYVYVIK